MKVEYTAINKGRKYQYKNLLIADKGLDRWSLVKKWNSGWDVAKDGTAISIRLRKNL